MMIRPRSFACALVLATALTPVFQTASAQDKPKSPSRDDRTVKSEHDMIGLGGEKASAEHTTHPDAQWYPDAGLGLFLHWGISSVKAMNISWPMIPGRPLGAKRIEDPAERERIIREGDWNLNGKPNSITPNEYWAMAKDFNPQQYDPDQWCKAAKEAGFTYVVLTARHHEGFALWPSKFGEFNTKNYAGGKDLIKPYVEACRKNGLKVGLYYSPPDWYFDRDYMSFLYHGARKTNPELPNLGPDLKPRTLNHTPEETEAHQKAFAEEVRGQIEELLTNYGKIDLLWFDGKPAIPDGDKVISAERIRELQPGIVINPRLHGRGDYITFERTLKADKPVQGWAEFCNTWTTAWPYVEQPYRANGYVLSQLATARSLGVNYLLGIGPDKDGQLAPDAYKNMAIVADWMKKNGSAVHAVRPLPEKESANVPATSAGSTRYLFALPQFKDKGAYPKDLLPPTDTMLTLKGIAKPTSVKLLSDGSTPKFTYADDTLTVELPASARTDLPDVVQVDLPATTN
jgi:alpha-L-fucosidase